VLSVDPAPPGASFAGAALLCFLNYYQFGTVPELSGNRNFTALDYFRGEGASFMKPSEIYKENADNCAMLAEGEPSKDSPAYKRYRRMEQAWRSLAEEQEWLDGEVPPLGTDRADVSTRPPG
jgi:hypothetical protein